MKKIYFILLFLSSILVFCQFPYGIGYQTSVVDNNGKILSNANVALKISILDKNNNSVDYSEVHNIKTNIKGIASVFIGLGKPIIGDFKTISWERGNKYLKMEVDNTGNNNFETVGSVQFMSVPYAIASKKLLLEKGEGIELISPSGNKYSLKVDDDGNFKTTIIDEKKELENLESVYPVDLKGTVVDFSYGRVLTYVTKDGDMYFKNGRYDLEKISVKDFIGNLVSHDGFGIDYKKINWTELPSSATDEEKKAKLENEKSKWKMISPGVSFSKINKDSKPVSLLTMDYPNGTIQNGLTFYRSNNTFDNCTLKDPIIGNVAFLIIKDDLGNLIGEYKLSNYNKNLRWGKILPNYGSIRYSEAIDISMNFSNNKSITLPIELQPGRYKMILRLRRYGSNLVDGKVKISSNKLIGSFTLSGDSNAEFKENASAVLRDYEESVNLQEKISYLTLTAEAPLTKKLITNDMMNLLKWGFNSYSNYGIITEYDSVNKRNGMVYLSSDNGENWQSIFDVSALETGKISEEATSVNIGGGHIHGAFIDLFSKKIYVLAGDLKHTKGVYYSDLNDQDNIKWNRALYQDFGNGYSEQYCAGFSFNDKVLFATDAIPSGIFYMKKANNLTMEERKQSLIVNGNQLSHFVTSFYKKDNNSPLLINFIQADQIEKNRLNQTNRVFSTYDGQNYKEIFKDNIINGRLGYNNYSVIFSYGKYVFLQIYDDNRFSSNSTLLVGEFKQ